MDCQPASPLVNSPGRSSPLLVNLACFATSALGIFSIVLAIKASGTISNSPAKFADIIIVGVATLVGGLSIMGAVGLFWRRQWGWWILAILCLFGLGGSLASGLSLVFLSRSSTFSGLGFVPRPIPWAKVLFNQTPRFLGYLAVSLILLTKVVRSYLRPGVALTWPRRVPLVVALVMPMALVLIFSLLVPTIVKSTFSSQETLKKQLSELGKERQENERKLQELDAQERAMLETRLRSAKTKEEKAKISRLIEFNKARTVQTPAGHPEPVPAGRP